MINVLASGIDTLYLSVKAKPSEAFVEYLRAEKADIEDKETPFEIPPFKFMLQNHRARMYEFLLKGNELDLKVSESLIIPNLLIELRSSFIHQNGHIRAVKKVKEMLDCGILDKSNYGDEPDYEKKYTINVSRVDLFCDIQNIDFKKEILEEIQTRARRKQIFFDGDHFTGFLIGKLPFGFRMYDKTAEIKVKREKGWIKEVWHKNPLYNDNQPVTRIEFELGSAKLAEFKIGDFKDDIRNIDNLPKSLLSLWNYCLDQFNLKENGINKQKTRRKESDIWKQLRKADFEGNESIEVDQAIRFFKEEKTFKLCFNSFFKLLCFWGYNDLIEAFRYFYDRCEDHTEKKFGLNLKDYLLIERIKSRRQ
jgi:hypothetical protein